MQQLEHVCTRLNLTLSQEKTRVVQATKDSFSFLGFEVQKIVNPKTGKWWPRVRPAAKSLARVRERLRELLNRNTRGRPVMDVIDEVNALLRGWGDYFHFGHPVNAMRNTNDFAQHRLRKWLMRRRQRRGQGYTEYPTRKLYDTFGLYNLPTHLPHAAPNASG